MLGNQAYGQKEPITSEILRNMFDKFASDGSNLFNLRLVNMCILGFVCFFRFAEIANLRACDFVSESKYMKVFVLKSKCDQFREGAWVFVACSGESGIPDRLFKRHGRWRSESAKDGYVSDSLGKLLSVSSSLGV